MTRQVGPRGLSAVFVIAVALAVTRLSDTALRDLGVLGLAVCLTGCRNQRLVLRG
jgi:hypothetical protein